MIYYSYENFNNLPINETPVQITPFELSKIIINLNLFSINNFNFETRREIIYLINNRISIKDILIFSIKNAKNNQKKIVDSIDKYYYNILNNIKNDPLIDIPKYGKDTSISTRNYTFKKISINISKSEFEELYPKLNLAGITIDCIVIYGILNGISFEEVINKFMAKTPNELIEFNNIINELDLINEYNKSNDTTNILNKLVENIIFSINYIILKISDIPFMWYIIINVIILLIILQIRRMI